MLTHNDQTVKDANDVFQSCKDLPVQHWGFKNVGLSGAEMKALVKNMKDAGKTKLIKRFVKEVDGSVCIAGSIDTFERIDFMKEIAPWGFTMGSALFKKMFVKDGSFRDNLKAVNDYLLGGKQ